MICLFHTGKLAVNIELSSLRGQPVYCYVYWFLVVTDACLDMLLWRPIFVDNGQGPIQVPSVAFYGMI